MPITIVGNPVVGSAGNGGNVTLIFGTSPQPGDVVYVFGGAAIDRGADLAPATAGYSPVKLSAGSGFDVAVWRKVMGPAPDANVVCTGSGHAQDAIAYVAYVLRGVDETTPEDVAAAEAFGTGVAADPPPVTIATAGAWVIVFGAKSLNFGDATAPPGYGNFAQIGQTDTNRVAVYAATKEIASPGAEDPGAFALASAQDWHVFTVAVRPAGSTPTPTRPRLPIGQVFPGQGVGVAGLPTGWIRRAQ